LNDLSTSKHGKAKKINQLEKYLKEGQNFVVEQHKLGFSKAFQQAKFSYKILLNEGNFNVRKDFHNGEFVPIDDIPKEETANINATVDVE